jgi:histone-lysine N-methyltransferase SETMAR
VNVENKEQSKQWMHTHSQNKPKKFKQTLSARNLIATVFWDRKGVLTVQHGSNMASEVYCETLKELHRAIHNKRSGMLTYGVVLLHDSERPHTAARTRVLLEHFYWELFDHPPYSPDLAPSNYHLFTLSDELVGITALQ